jgi:hypothetical protein
MGIVLYALSSNVSGWLGSASDLIRLSSGDLAVLQASWEQQWGRPPTADELEGLVERQVREEVLYREAIALGLDRGDTIVRRRLAQKMEFLAAGSADGAVPRDDELQAFLEQHSQRFRVPGRVSFEQIYFGRDRHGQELAAVATQALEALRAGAVVDGDRFLLPRHQQGLTDQRVNQVFGQEFGDAVVGLEPGRWEGPIGSGYGLHLVWVEENRPGRAAALEEVREAVLREWQAERQDRQSQAFYRELRARYSVEIEDR